MLSILSLISFAQAVVAVLVGFYTVYKAGLKHALTAPFLTVIVMAVLWSLGNTFSCQTGDPGIKMMWYYLGASGWTAGPSVILFFVYSVIRQPGNKPAILSLFFFIPYIFFLSLLLTGNLIPPEWFIPDGHSISRFDTKSIWGMVFAWFFILTGVFSFIKVISWKRKQKLRKYHVQVNVFLYSLFISLLIGLLADLILPAKIPGYPLPDFGNLFLFCWMVFAGFHIVRYRMLTNVPEIMADKLIADFSDVFILVDMEGKILRMNSMTEKLLGYGDRCMECENIRELIVETETLDQEVFSHFGVFENTELQFSFRTASGDSIPFNCQITLVRDRFQDPAGYIFFARDMREMTELTKIARQLQESNKELLIRSITDPLTGAFNRLKFLEVVDNEMARSKRYKTRFSIIMFDLDHFKEINDTHGHEAGDKLLIAVSALVKKTIRETDVFARWGGEEFFILCPETGIEGVRILADRLCGLVPREINGFKRKITASFGITEFRKDDSAQVLFARSDSAMYQAKNMGRNRVITA
ncbi:MAG: hypothetical protein A2Y33_01575 [Spirochaetes bacterium GWF1_51_8]|nr:MAG: hypothetical protein A2Y33_01575 [Spirochaetes bacterium GWF1_51_8]